VEAAAKYVDKHAEEGVVCPCCGKWVKSYWRGINRAMASALYWIVQMSADGKLWVDVPNTGPDWLLRTNQHTTLQWWGLIERKPNTDTKKKHSGLWRPTVTGLAFAAGRLRVPEKVLTRDGEVIGWSKSTTDFAQAMGKSFDYSEIMRRGP
jgi:hypothetical protein